MSTVKKTRPLPVDHEAAAAEQRRREDLANSDPVQRGVRQAREQALSNCRGEVQSRLGDLKKCTLLRDVNTPGRDSYNRCHSPVSESRLMRRDAYADFADSPGLREQIAEALNEREERQAIDADMQWIQRLLRHWERRGRPQMFFKYMREAGPIPRNLRD